MLVTQFATLEEPGSDESDVLVVDIDHSLDEVVAATVKLSDQHLRLEEVTFTRFETGFDGVEVAFQIDETQVGTMPLLRCNVPRRFQ
jgi:hypothetical protein